MIPNSLPKLAKKMIANLLDVETISSIRSLPKVDFFHSFRDAQYLIRKYSASLPVGTLVSPDR
jgi:hypothetical protein